MEPPEIRHHAKRLLAEIGVTEPGTDAARAAARVVASELRIQGATLEEAIAAVLLMPVLGGKPPNSLTRQLVRAARFAYSTPTPILTGCAADPRPHGGNPTTAAMRSSFAPYCAADCQRTCPMLRAIKNPDRSLFGTPYQTLDRSSIWMHGGGLGQAGRTAFQILAQLAVLFDTDEVQASGGYITMKSGGAYSPQHIRKTLARMQKLGILDLLNKRTGLRRIYARDEAWVIDLEKQLSLHGKQAANIADARKHADDYADWIARQEADFAKTEQDDSLADWNPAPPEEPADDLGKHEPAFLQSWNGRIRS